MQEKEEESVVKMDGRDNECKGVFDKVHGGDDLLFMPIQSRLPPVRQSLNSMIRFQFLKRRIGVAMTAEYNKICHQWCASKH